MVNIKDNAESFLGITKPRIKALSDDVLERLKFTLSHVLLSPHQTMAVMSCGTGRLAYEYALLKPHVTVVGFDRSTQNIKRARKLYQLDNLQFAQGTSENFENYTQPIDTILDIGNLHRLYSRTGYNKARILSTLKAQTEKLEIDGTLIIQDFFTPKDDKFVFLELSKNINSDDDFSEISKAELLLKFAQTARPLDISGAQGFFVEEVDAHRAGTRLFQLPLKWALDFIYRMDDQINWDKNLEQEYTPTSLFELSKEIESFGMRTQFYAPYWRESSYGDDFCLYDEDFTEMEELPRGEMLVLQKIATSTPIIIKERRSALTAKKEFNIEVVVDIDKAETHDLVKPNRLVNDLLPWRVDENGVLLVTVQKNVPRPLINAAPRGSSNLDGKKWSGYMIEPITMPATNESSEQAQFARDIILDYFDIKQSQIGQIAQASQYYPKPNTLVQRVSGYIARLKGDVALKQLDENSKHRDLNLGDLIELPAQDVLKAIQVGLIPDSRLEILIFQLMRRAGVQPDQLSIMTNMIKDQAIEDEIWDEEAQEKFEQEQKTFISTDQVAGSIKHVQSVFVEEGSIDGLSTGLGTIEKDFILPTKHSLNTVVCFPITSDSSTGVKMIGVVPKKAPVPDRLGDNGGMISLPTLTLSNDIKTLYQTRVFLTKQFDCELDQVQPIGSSYFSHPEMSPERIYPFTIYNPGKAGIINLKFARMDTIKKLMNSLKPHGQSTGTVMFKAMRKLGEWYQGGIEKNMGYDAKEVFEKKIDPTPTSLALNQIKKNYEPD